jgi:hypothetical protein
LSFYFEFFNAHISHLTQHFMISMVLKWYHKKISHKIVVFIKFWWSFDVIFGSFDCDCTFMHIQQILKGKKNEIFWVILQHIVMCNQQYKMIF